jgi:hypothetical protein
LFRLFDFVIQSSQAGAVVDLELCSQARRNRVGEGSDLAALQGGNLPASREGVLKLSISQAVWASSEDDQLYAKREGWAEEPQAKELSRRLSLAIVRSIFESMQGSFQAGKWGDRMWLELRAPLAEDVAAQAKAASDSR